MGLLFSSKSHKLSTLLFVNCCFSQKPENARSFLCGYFFHPKDTNPNSFLFVVVSHPKVTNPNIGQGFAKVHNSQTKRVEREREREREKQKVPLRIRVLELAFRCW